MNDLVHKTDSDANNVYQSYETVVEEAAANTTNNTTADETVARAAEEEDTSSPPTIPPVTNLYNAAQTVGGSVMPRLLDAAIWLTSLDVTLDRPSSSFLTKLSL